MGLTCFFLLALFDCGISEEVGFSVKPPFASRNFWIAHKEPRSPRFFCLVWRRWFATGLPSPFPSLSSLRNYLILSAVQTWGLSFYFFCPRAACRGFYMDELSSGSCCTAHVLPVYQAAGVQVWVVTSVWREMTRIKAIIRIIERYLKTKTSKLAFLNESEVGL